MFERFTEGARRVVVLAQNEGRLLRHNYIGTEHLLLGLTHLDEGVVAEALAEFGVGLDDVRARVLEMIGSGAVEPSGHIPFTPRAKKVLELSLRESLNLGGGHIGTEHLLLGLLREGEGVGAQVLRKLGVDLDGLRQEITRLGGDAARIEHFADGPLPEPPPLRPAAGFVGVMRGPEMMLGPALVAIAAVLTGLAAVSIDGSMTVWLRTALVLWAGGLVALSAAVVTSAEHSPFHGAAWRVARWAGLVAVILFVVGGVLVIGDALAA